MQAHLITLGDQCHKFSGQVFLIHQRISALTFAPEYLDGIVIYSRNLARLADTPAAAKKELRASLAGDVQAFFGHCLERQG